VEPHLLLERPDPERQRRTRSALADAINAKWGSFDKFKEEFTKSCVGNFGSSWTWLVKKPTVAGHRQHLERRCPLTTDAKRC
jgi:Fe-Mn family superoxide dismutase